MGMLPGAVDANLMMLDAWCMMQHRTTLSIDEDVLAYARQLSEVSGKPLGTIISELARAAMTKTGAAPVRNGIQLLPIDKNAKSATLEDVNRLRDESP